MIRENVSILRFTDEEVIQGLVSMLDLKVNTTKFGTPEHEGARRLKKHIENNYCAIEVDENGLVLVVDGVVDTETFDLLNY